jgi:hypothetical protein
MSQRGRPATGHIRRRPRTDGLTTFALRVRAYVDRHHVRLGTEAEGWSDARAEIELASVLAQIRAGTWSPPEPQSTGEAEELPSFHEYASLWFKRRVTEGISNNTRKDLLWQLSNHLLPHFGSYRVDEITHELVVAFKDRKLDERARIVVAAEAGEVLRDASGRTRRPLSNTSINKSWSFWRGSARRRYGAAGSRRTRRPTWSGYGCVARRGRSSRPTSSSR